MPRSRRKSVNAQDPREDYMGKIEIVVIKLVEPNSCSVAILPILKVSSIFVGYKALEDGQKLGV